MAAIDQGAATHTGRIAGIGDCMRRYLMFGPVGRDMNTRPVVSIWASIVSIERIAVISQMIPVATVFIVKPTSAFYQQHSLAAEREFTCDYAATCTGPNNDGVEVLAEVGFWTGRSSGSRRALWAFRKAMLVSDLAPRNCIRISAIAGISVDRLGHPVR
ncbi:hypothetical protein GCM10007913_39820 [Devosia yakushimensis]|uniref:Uncharacterized protein n=1 Tax=Devosia yakushimensis TaxID=470028 RepID=A0ABQ5UJN7_9HYPH|nr:hypothetical protein GCM10007913_39820 [Devosia yakushimensis]